MFRFMNLRDKFDFIKKIKVIEIYYIIYFGVSF